MWADAILAVISTPTAMAIAVPVLELILRVTKTKNPQSVLVPVKYACFSLAKILAWTGAIMEVMITTGNNVKPPTEEKAP